jgi:mono/diheme cytochrome c family protein
MFRSKASTCKALTAIATAVCFVGMLTPSAHAQGDAPAIYAAKCAACHGPDGAANTPAGKAVAAHDFHSAEVQNQTDDQLTVTVAKGKNKMPAYEKMLKEQQIKDLVTYCRNLGKKK